MEKELNDKLLKIAQQTISHFNRGYRDDLNTHNSDSDDFFEIAIWELRNALKTAYESGYYNGFSDAEFLTENDII